ncbi:MAG: hypothetical protein NG737_00030 [Omnitrophica bacterium]|nr:hypothetical protein [Candidatus Omnitrophota bacterium]
MIVIIISSIMLVSILLTAFISFSPNFALLVDQDFMRRAQQVAYYTGLEYADLNARTGDLIPGGASLQTGFGLRQRNDNDAGWVQHDHMQVVVNLTATGELNAFVTHEYD